MTRRKPYDPTRPPSYGNSQPYTELTASAIATTMSLFLRHDTVVLLVVDRADEGGEVGYQASLKSMDFEGELHHLFEPMHGVRMFAEGGATVRAALEALEALCQQHLVDTTVALTS